MGETKENQQPIQRSVRVDCPIEDAFRFFTEHFAEWWPLASHSLAAEEAETCAIEPWVGGRLFERTRSGQEREWGTVTVWEAASRITFAWHPGAESDEAQTVDIEFRTDGVGTEVILTHSGWEAPAIQGSVGAQAPDFVTAVAERFLRFICDQMMVTA
jgi:hypothetical protein